MPGSDDKLPEPPCLAEDLLLSFLTVSARRDPEVATDLLAMAQGFEVAAASGALAEYRVERCRELAHALRVALLQAESVPPDDPGPLLRVVK